MPTFLLLAATLAAAPVPKGASVGRITIWSGDELVSMLPGGTDVQTSPAWKSDGRNFDDSKLCPDLKTLLVRRHPTGRVGGNENMRLILVPLEGDQIEVEGIMPARFLISPDGGTLYISGKRDDDPAAVYENWTYGVATKMLSKLPMPARKSPDDRLFLDAVSQDGKTFLVGGPEQNNGTWEWRNYLVSEGGKTSVPILEANNFTRSEVLFSPGGGRIFMNVTAHSSITVTKTSTTHGPETSRETVVFDVATRGKTKLPKPPVGDSYGHIAWSPGGSQFACVCQVPPPQQMPGLPRMPAAQPTHDYRIYVMNADGTNPVEIYKLDAAVKGLIWK
jgi:hypothetical protein